jgi:perosamine synthetase
MKIPLSKPSITQREIDLVTEVLKSGTLSLGSRLPEFEHRFAAYVGTRYAVAVNSGTSGLHLCVRALEIGAEDAVITSSFSFVASANCLLYEGALPIFVDIDPVTLNLDPQEIERYLEEECTYVPGGGFPIDRRTGRRIKAILPVHVFGLPCDMAQIRELADKYGLHIIEDACEALGAAYREQRVGTFGDAAVFAFYPNKQMTTGEGGMIVTDDARIAEACRSMRNQGRDENCSWLQHARLGYNYRLSELHCALGLAQLERVEELLQARAQVASMYQEALNGIEQIVLPSSPADRTRSWFVYVVQLNLPSPRAIRDGILQDLRDQGFGSQAYFPAIHRQPYFEAYAPRNGWSLPHTEQASESSMALPFFPGESSAEVEQVTASLSMLLQHNAGIGKMLMSA